MKKFITLLFLSLFVSQIHAAMLPLDLNAASDTVVTSGHDHCQEILSTNHPQDAKSGAAGATHHCCAVVAILMAPPTFSLSQQVDVYLHGDVMARLSNIAESIYKPPKHSL
ncbi:MAG: hypothetical protein ACOYB0_01460 [Polynucleobacter sp.]|jgi:hypothetical protein